MRALIVTHGNLGEALRHAAAGILGPQPGLTAVGNDGLSLDDLVARVSLELRLPGEPVLVFVDFVGGSCHTASRKAIATLPEADRGEKILGLAAGVNLPMLLTFLTRRATTPAEEMLELVLDRGRRGIRS